MSSIQHPYLKAQHSVCKLDGSVKSLDLTTIEPELPQLGDETCHAPLTMTTGVHSVCPNLDRPS